MAEKAEVSVCSGIIIAVKKQIGRREEHLSFCRSGLRYTSEGKDSKSDSLLELACLSKTCYSPRMLTCNRTRLLLACILPIVTACNKTYDSEGCFTVTKETKTCPAAGDVNIDALYLPGQCGSDLEIIDVSGAGKRKDITNQDGSKTPACCYTVEVEDHDSDSSCTVGRPFRVDESLRVASLRSQTGWG